MVYGAHGIKPDPSNVEALEHISTLTNKEDLISFLCMMQSNNDFIPNFQISISISTTKLFFRYN